MESSEIISAHRQAQQSRVSGGDEFLIVSDTTYLTFPRHPEKEGLGDISSTDIDVEGVKLHSSIGIRPDTHQMTGIIDQQVLVDICQRLHCRLLQVAGMSDAVYRHSEPGAEYLYD